MLESSASESSASGWPIICGNADFMSSFGTARRGPFPISSGRPRRSRSFAISSRFLSRTMRRCSRWRSGLRANLTPEPHRHGPLHGFARHDAGRGGNRGETRRALSRLPFTGSKTAAEKGQLVYYVGGDEAALRQARPVLEASSKEIIEIGKVGDATTIKVATNMVTAASVQAAAEALALISKSGLPVEKFADAMRNNGSNSATLDMKLPMMMEGNFEPHFSVKHMLKDVVIATRLARGFGMEFGATDASRHGLTEEMRQGRGDDGLFFAFPAIFPGGRSAQSASRSNGEDDQPRFAGMDEGKAAEPEAVPEAVETTAEVPSEAKAMGEVVPAPAAANLAPNRKPERAQEVAGHTDAAAATKQARNRPRSAAPEPAATPKPLRGRTEAEGSSRAYVPSACEGRGRRGAARNVGRLLAAADGRLSSPEASLMTQLFNPSAAHFLTSRPA